MLAKKLKLFLSLRISTGGKCEKLVVSCLDDSVQILRGHRQIVTEEQDTEREVIAEMVEDITTNLEALPEYDGDLGGFLDIINGQLEDCYEELSPDQKKKLAIKLTSVLGESHENLSKAVVHHPNFVRLLGVVLNMQHDPNFQARRRHPSYRPIRDAITTATRVLSLTPGKFDLVTGAHTPPER